MIVVVAVVVVAASIVVFCSTLAQSMLRSLALPNAPLPQRPFYPSLLTIAATTTGVEKTTTTTAELLKPLE